MWHAKWKQHQQFIRFCLVGMVNTGVDFTVFWLLNSLSFPLIMAQSISYGCGVLNSFMLNRSWTFKKTGQIFAPLCRFVILNLFTLFVTSSLLVYFHEVQHWPLMLCKIISIGVNVMINFAGNRLWVFSPLRYKGKVNLP